MERGLVQWRVELDQAKARLKFPTFLDDDCHVIFYDFPSWKAETSWFFMLRVPAGDDRSLGGTCRKFSFQSTFLVLESRRRWSIWFVRGFVFQQTFTGREANHFSLHTVHQGSDARSLEDWKDAISQIEENIKEREPTQDFMICIPSSHLQECKSGSALQQL